MSASLIFAFMKIFVNPIIKETGASKIKEDFAYCVNKSVDDIMRGAITYDDLITVVRDSSGKIVLLQVNSIQINSLTRKIIDATYVSLITRLGDTISVPLGSFSGIPLLSGLGPRVNVKALPYPAVKCKFLSKFNMAGINQTLHKIYLLVETDVSVVLPFSKISVQENSEVLVSESLIVGEIPDTYLMAAENGDMLNMVG